MWTSRTYNLRKNDVSSLAIIFDQKSLMDSFQPVSTFMPKYFLFTSLNDFSCSMTSRHSFRTLWSNKISSNLSTNAKKKKDFCIISDFQSEKWKKQVRPGLVGPVSSCLWLMWMYTIPCLRTKNIRFLGLY